MRTSNLFDQEKARLKREAEAAEEPGTLIPTLKGVVIVDVGDDPPRPNWWYVYQMKLRFEWPKRENRETVIRLFKEYWPMVAKKAEAFYDTAEADPRTAAEILEAYRWREKPKPRLMGEEATKRGSG